MIAEYLPIRKSLRARIGARRPLRLRYRPELAGLQPLSYLRVITLQLADAIGGSVALNLSRDYIFIIVISTSSVAYLTMFRL